MKRKKERRKKTIYRFGREEVEETMGKNRTFLFFEQYQNSSNSFQSIGEENLITENR